ncbi:hypothetical protein, partial [Bradyrhizobium guangdongense]|uniref:hypothetical protein n=1 Tax=Bradyrhizobium guangdongense TaxID=1325090 RepID=UPI001AEC9B05
RQEQQVDARSLAWGDFKGSSIWKAETVWWILRELMRKDSAHAVISHALRFRGYVAESRFFQMGETSEMACRKGV